MSSSKDFLFDHHIVAGLYVSSDCFDSGKTTDWICLRDYRRITFLIATGVVNTANGQVTINAATSAAGAGSVAMTFRYKVCASSTTVDTWGTSTAAAATGFAMTATANYVYICEVNAEEVQAALAGANFVSLTVAETTNDPALATVIAILSEPRFPQAVPITAIA